MTDYCIGIEILAFIYFWPSVLEKHLLGFKWSVSHAPISFDRGLVPSIFTPDVRIPPPRM